jgi:hypothetical protein
MNKGAGNPNVVPENQEPIADKKAKGPNRRQFLGGVSGAAAAAASLGAIGLEPLLGGKDSVRRRRLFAIRRISGRMRAYVTGLKQQEPRTSTFRNSRTMATPRGLPISAEITARPWHTMHLVCPTWLPTKVYYLR